MASRKKRAIDGPSGPASFTLVSADTVIANDPPVVTSELKLDMFEDDGFRYVVEDQAKSGILKQCISK